MAAESSPSPMPVSQTDASLRHASAATPPGTFSEAAWRRFVRRFLVLLLGLLVTLGLLNYLVNPEGIFSTHLTVLETKLSILSIQEAVTGVERGEGTFEANGYLKNDFWKALREQGKLDVKSRFEQRAAQYQARYASYVAPSKERLEYFTKLLRYCRERHIAVIVFMTPMHPDLKARLRPYGYDQRRDEAAA